jgi:hypothetical protein
MPNLYELEKMDRPEDWALDLMRAKVDVLFGPLRNVSDDQKRFAIVFAELWHSVDDEDTSDTTGFMQEVLRADLEHAIWELLGGEAPLSSSFAGVPGVAEGDEWFLTRSLESAVLGITCADVFSYSDPKVMAACVRDLGGLLAVLDPPALGEALKVVSVLLDLPSQFHTAAELAPYFAEFAGTRPFPAKFAECLVGLAEGWEGAFVDLSDAARLLARTA